MVLVMLALLMVQMRSFGRMALVIVTAPLGLIGVAAALLVTGRPFGFVAMLGFIALAGIIMRNSVILVDQIQHDLREGQAPADAIVGGDGAAGSADFADGGGGDLRAGAAGAVGVLGADGDRDHGRVGGGDGADAVLRAGAVCGLDGGASGGCCWAAAGGGGGGEGGRAVAGGGLIFSMAIVARNLPRAMVHYPPL